MNFIHFLGLDFLSGEKGEKGDKGDRGEAGGTIPLSIIIDTIYPVGCYFETTDTTFNPNTEWENTTWTLEDEGLVHVSSGTNYSVSNLSQDGGEATHTLTAAESGVPSHGHGMTQASYKTTSSGHISGGITGGSHAHTSKGYLTCPTFSSGSYKMLIGNGSDKTYSVNSSTHTHDLPNHNHTITINTNASVSNNTAADASLAHNNMQPYKIVNRWHRTA